MDNHEKIWKLRKACGFNVDKLNAIIENFLPLENHFLNIDENLKTFCYVPNEANFQLPNIFLKTSLTSACTKYLQSNVEKNDYSKTIDLIIDELEVLREDFDFLEIESRENIAENTLSSIYKKRYGL